MAVDGVPVPKRCGSFGLNPVYLGIDKESGRELKRVSRKTSEYDLQLHEEQKVRFVCGALEKPLRNYYAEASKMDGMVDRNPMVLLEERLDNVVFRTGFSRTRRETRQMVDHKSTLVNGKCANIPSYLIRADDVIEVKEKSKPSQRFKDAMESTAGRTAPARLDVDAGNLRSAVKEMSIRGETNVLVNEMFIVELYSE